MAIEIWTRAEWKQTGSFEFWPGRRKNTKICRVGECVCVCVRDWHYGFQHSAVKFTFFYACSRNWILSWTKNSIMLKEKPICYFMACNGDTDVFPTWHSVKHDFVCKNSWKGIYKIKMLHNSLIRRIKCWSMHTPTQAFCPHNTKLSFLLLPIIITTDIIVLIMMCIRNASAPSKTVWR